MRIDIGELRGKTLLEALRAQAAGASPGWSDTHAAPCGGRGSCGKCRVRVLAGGELLEPMSSVEAAFIEPDDRAEGWRLSCQARIRKAEGAAAGAGPGAATLDIETAHDTMRIPVETSLHAHLGAASRAVAAHGAGNGASAEPERPLRLAVDLGTTTIAGHLFDAARAESLGVATRVNGQRAWGADVISRIQAAGDPAVREELRKAAIAPIAAIMRELCAEVGRECAEVGAIVVAGNTVMQHLLFGCDPTGLGALPFTPVFLDSRSEDAAASGLPAAPGVRMTTMPGISAFVGGDLTAGIIAVKLHKAERPTLLLDIGTNGEMILAADGKLYGTATAAGPAFEGAHIECGAPSVPGAIDHAGWDGNACWHSTIGDLAPVGICGSGLLDLAAAMLVSGRMDETGYLEDGRCTIDSDANIFISQNDIRQIQLAKGAMAAGIGILCRSAGIRAADIMEVHLAGGFGSYLDPKSALAIGLLPPELSGKVIAAGNTSLRGATEAAADEWVMAECAHVARSTVAVDLASHPEFQDVFMDCMLFPETPVAGATAGAMAAGKAGA